MELLKKKKEDLGLQGICATSSKNFEDFNVHLAFTTCLHAAMMFKYIGQPPPLVESAGGSPQVLPVVQNEAGDVVD